MPIKLDGLKKAAKQRDWDCNSQTIKIPDESHPFGAKQPNFNIEINYSRKEPIWFGFSINSDNNDKKEKARSLKEVCMKKMIEVVGDRREKFEGSYNSYTFYGAIITYTPEKACDELQHLFDISRDIKI